jgi:hypothetical protein
MTPDQAYLLAQLRMAETEAMAEYARMTAGRRPEPLWRAVWSRLRRDGDRAASTDTVQRARPATST